jgi:tetratricopeptide (TPR) repeat protein
MNTLQPDPIFVRQIKAALRYWQTETKQMDDEALLGVDGERQHLYRAVEYGLVLRETWLDTAVVVHQSYPLIERRGYWREWMRVLEKMIASCPSDQLLLQAQFLNQLGALHCRSYELDRSLAVHQEAELIALRQEDERVLAETYACLSETFFRQNKLDSAESYGKQALAILSQMVDAEHALAGLLQTLGNVSRWRRDGSLAQDRLLEVVHLRRKEGSSLLLARALNDLGMAYRLSNQRPKAYQVLFEAAEFLDGSLYELDKSMNRLNIGCLYYDDEQWVEAEKYFHQADSTYIRQFSSAEFQARINHHIGNALLRQKKFKEAVEQFQRAVTLWREAGEVIELANTLDSLGEAEEGLGWPEMALGYYREAVLLLRPYVHHERGSYLLQEIMARPLYRQSSQKTPS